MKKAFSELGECSPDEYNLAGFASGVSLGEIKTGVKL